MSLRFLLDTNVISEPTRPTPNPGIIERLQVHQGDIAISTVVWHELLFGCRRLPASRKRRVLEKYLSDVVLASIPILSYDTAAADWHATERARLERLGQKPPFADTQIAAVAVAHGLTVVTVNLADFAAFQGLKIEDWRS